MATILSRGKLVKLPRRQTITWVIDDPILWRIYGKECYSNWVAPLVCPALITLSALLETMKFALAQLGKHGRDV